MTPPSPSRRNYTYAVVAHNGAGVYSEHNRCSDARAAMERVAATYVLPQTFEIERIEHVASGRRYQMRNRSRWVPWDPKVGHETRRPDWIATSEGRHR